MFLLSLVPIQAADVVTKKKKEEVYTNLPGIWHWPKVYKHGIDCCLIIQVEARGFRRDSSFNETEDM